MVARHHHYLSKFYLKGFTKGRAKKSKLTVIDFIFKKNHSKQCQEMLGGVRDFNRINLKGVDQNILESALSDFETKAATALKNIEKKHKFDGENKTLILTLIGLIAIRSPHQREHWRKQCEEIAERILSLSLENKERWESLVNNTKDVKNERKKS